MSTSEIIELIHNKNYVLGVWWYRTTDHKLEYLTDSVGGHRDNKFALIKEETTDRYLAKGRLVRYQGKVILFIYSAVPEPTNLSKEELNTLIKKIEEVSKEQILYVYNHRGDNLLENKETSIERHV